MALDLDEFQTSNGSKVHYGYRGPVFWRGRELGYFSNANGNYPCTVRCGKWSAGFSTLKEAMTELHARALNLNVKVSVENLFPDEYWILRLSQITMLANADPNTKPTIRCRLYFNSHNTTGASTASKPALYTTASIDPETFKIKCDKKMPKDFKGFANEKSIINKLKEGLCPA